MPKHTSYFRGKRTIGVRGEGKQTMLLQVPSTVSGVKALSHRSLRIQIDTNENLSDEQIAALTTKLDKYGHFLFLEDNLIKEEDLLNLPPLPSRPEDEKSPAVRLRNVLYRWWEQQGKHGDFEEAYRKQMDRLIDGVKEKLT